MIAQWQIEPEGYEYHYNEDEYKDALKRNKHYYIIPVHSYSEYRSYCKDFPSGTIFRLKAAHYRARQLRLKL